MDSTASITVAYNRMELEEKLLIPDELSIAQGGEMFTLTIVYDGDEATEYMIGLTFERD